MKTETVFVAVFLVSLTLFGLAAAADNALALYSIAIIAFGSVAVFCFTEGFLVEPSSRTRLNIYLARFFFVGSSLIVAQILFVLITGRAA